MTHDAIYNLLCLLRSLPTTAVAATAANATTPILHSIHVHVFSIT